MDYRSGDFGIVAILCNPPLGKSRDTITWRNLAVLQDVTGANRLEIVNLISVPSASTKDLAHLCGNVDVDDLAERTYRGAKKAELVVAAWGVVAPAGWKRTEWSRLTNMALDSAAEAGHGSVIHVGDGPRHPSRWRNYSSPVHGRYSGNSFDERLEQAIRRTPIGSFKTI